MIFGGWGRKVKPRGEVFFICPECQGLSVFGLFENYGYAQLYGVRIAKVGTNRLMVCARCRAGYALSRDQWDQARSIAAELASVHDMRGGHIRTSVAALAAVLAPDQIAAIDEHLRSNLDDAEVGSVSVHPNDTGNYVLAESVDQGSLMAGDGLTTKTELVDAGAHEKTMKLMAGKPDEQRPKQPKPKAYADPKSMMAGAGPSLTIVPQQAGSAIGRALRVVMPAIHAHDAAVSLESAPAMDSASKPGDVDHSDTFAGKIASELRALDGLLASGIVDEDEYRALRKRVLEG